MKPTFNLKNISLSVGNKAVVRIENIEIALGDTNVKDALLLAKEVPSIMREIKKVNKED